MGTAISFHRFSLGWHGGLHIRWLLDRVDLRLEPGRFYLLTGPSGAGKSTLLDLLADQFDPADLEWAQRGRVEMLAAGGRPPRVTTLFQQDGLWEDLSVLDNIRLAAGNRERARELLHRVGLAEAPRRVSRLSGGQRKKAALARALASAPDLLILDEPTAGLDRESSHQVMELLVDLFHRAEGSLTVILCTHDVAEGRRIADRELHLAGDGTLSLLPPGAAPAAVPPRPPRTPALPLGPLLGPPLAAAGLVASLADLLLALPPQDPLRGLGRGMLRLLGLSPFLTLTGAFLGGVVVHFTMANDPFQGAMAAELLGGAGKVVVALLLPLVASLLYAAPAVSSALAGIGAMARSRQLAAFRALGRSPRREVLSPLLWGNLVALPLAGAAASAAGIFGAWWALYLGRGMELGPFLGAFLAQVGRADLFWALWRFLGCALLVTWVPWHLARRPGLAPAELADAGLRGWIYAAVGIILVHGLLLFPQVGGQ